MKQWLFLLSYFSLFSHVHAVDNIHLELGTLAGAGWQAEQVVINLQWVKSQQIAFQLKIATLTLPALKKNSPISTSPVNKLNTLTYKFVVQKHYCR